MCAYRLYTDVSVGSLQKSKVSGMLGASYRWLSSRCRCKKPTSHPLQRQCLLLTPEHPLNYLCQLPCNFHLTLVINLDWKIE